MRRAKIVLAMSLSLTTLSALADNTLRSATIKNHSAALSNLSSIAKSTPSAKQSVWPGLLPSPAQFVTHAQTQSP